MKLASLLARLYRKAMNLTSNGPFKFQFGAWRHDISTNSNLDPGAQLRRNRRYVYSEKLRQREISLFARQNYISRDGRCVNVVALVDFSCVIRENTYYAIRACVSL